jgi:hypothetical protein
MINTKTRLKKRFKTRLKARLKTSLEKRFINENQRK